jgi:hypothetical protein
MRIAIRVRDEERSEINYSEGFTLQWRIVFCWLASTQLITGELLQASKNALNTRRLFSASGYDF